MGPRIREDTGGVVIRRERTLGGRGRAVRESPLWGVWMLRKGVKMGPRIREDTGGGLHVGGGGHAHEGEAAAEDDAGGGG